MFISPVTDIVAQATTEVYQNAPVEKEEEVPGNIIAEDKEGRDEYIKQFVMDNGNTLIAQYEYPIHYQDNSGNWTEYDNTLKTVETDLTDAEEDLQAVKPTEAATQQVTETAMDVSGETEETSNSENIEPKTITGTVIETQPETIPKKLNETEYANKKSNIDIRLSKKAKENNMVKIKKDGYQISMGYAGVNQSKKLFVVNNTEVLEGNDKYLNRKKTIGEVLYKKALENVDLQYFITPNGLKENIILQDKHVPSSFEVNYIAKGLTAVQVDDSKIELKNKKGNVIYTIIAPYMIDNEGEISTELKLTLKNGKKNKFVVEISMDKNWLNEWGRAYPITVDPIIGVGTSLGGFEVGNISSSTPNAVCSTSPSYLKVDNANIMIAKVTDLPKIPAGCTITNMTYYLSKNLGSGGLIAAKGYKNKSVDLTTTTWNNRPTGELVDYTKVSTTSSTKLDLTALAYQWYYEDKNYGFAVERVGNEAGTDYFQYYSPISTWSNPTLTVEYTYRTGVGNMSTSSESGEDSGEGFQHSIGRAGDGNVDAYTGRLNLHAKDIGFDGNVMPVQINRIYDTSFTQNMGFGTGWMTSYHQRLYKEKVSEETYYHFIDEQGAYHSFLEVSPSATTIKDKDGCCEITVNGDKTIENFTLKSGDIVKTFNSSGFVTSIKDTSQPAQPTIKITYFIPNSGMISTITDGSGRKYKFVYSYDGRKYYVSSIDYQGTGTSSLQRISYAYSGYGTTSCNLTSVTYADGEACNYTYSGNDIVKINEVSGYNVRYTYTGGKVTQIAEYAEDTAGDYLNIVYAKGKTTVTDAKKQNLTINFDHYGNRMSTVDETGSVIYYDTKGNDKGLIGTSKKMRPPVNYFLNPSFEETNGQSNFAVTANSGSTQVNYRSSTGVNTGDYSLSMSSKISSKYQICQTIGDSSHRENQTTTFSAWVKTEGTNAKVSIAVQDIVSGTKITSEPTSTNGKWEQIYVTLPKTSRRYFKCYLTYEGIGTVYFDDVQLNPSDEPMDLSYIIDGNMQSYTDKWEYQNGYAYELEGDTNKESYAKQRVYINGWQGDTFTVLGIASAGSASKIGKDELDNKPFFGIRVVALNMAEPLAEVEFNGTYNASYTGGETCDMQAAEFRLPADCAYVDVYFRYDYNINNAYIGNIALVKDKLYHYTNGMYGTDPVYSTEASDDDYDPSAGSDGEEDEDTNTYDSYGRVTKEVAENGLITTYTYDNYGNTLSETKSDGTTSITTNNTYTSDGNYQTIEKNEFGKGTTNTYNTNLGTITSEKSVLGSAAQYSFDSMGRPTGMQVSNVGGNGTAPQIATQYGYAGDDQTSTTHNGFAYQTNYNVWGDPTSVKVGSQTLASYQYTDNVSRQLQQINYGNGQPVYYNYTQNANQQTLLSGVRYGGDSKDRYAYTYGNTGNLLQIDDNINGRKTIFQTDGIKRIYSTAVSTLDELLYSVVSKENSEYSTSRYETVFGNNTMFKITDNSTTNTTMLTYDQSGTNVKQLTQKDIFDRVSSQVVSNRYASNVVKTEYNYQGTGTNKSSYRVEKESITRGTGSALEYSYTYDDAGNITQIKRGTSVQRKYTYDNLGQLIQEDNMDNGQCTKYEYDNGGNVISEKVFYVNSDYLQGAKTFTYGDSNWKDKLTSCGGKAITYDEIGNPISYDGAELKWTGGRQLSRYSKSGTVADYSYDENGLRASKTLNGVTTRYIYDDGKLVALKGDKAIYFRYDQDDKPISFQYDGEEYFYVKNIQGDILQILDKTGSTKVTYNYDAWGKVLSVTGTLASTIGQINPLRYRGYVYDTETGFYYLQSRYYNPQWKRFINADVHTDTGTGALGANMFAYCENNPVTNDDPAGDAAANIVGGIVGGVIGALLGVVIANALKLKGWKRALFIAAVTVAGAVLGAIIGPYVAKASKAVIRVINAGIKTIKTGASRAIKNVAKYKVKSPHLKGAKGTKSKFNTISQKQARKWIKDALKSSKARYYENSADSYYIITDMGKKIGTKGERLIKVVFTKKGKIITTFPVKGFK